MSDSRLLAQRGGPKVRASPFPRWPSYSPAEVEAAVRVYQSGKVNYWTGTEGKAFENEYAAHLGLRHAVSLMNGTVAIELALRAHGIGPGDEVVVPSRTFVATAAAAVSVGARPVVADVDRDSGNVTAETIRAVMGPRTRAVVPVHLGGWPCDMDPILELGRSRGIAVIEDCAQAHGATDRGRPVGSMGDSAAFSFCQDKIITTGGEGGLFATDDDATWKRAWSYKDHGKSYDAVHRPDHPPGFRWLHESFGTNWRMTEAQAAIGRVQLGELPGTLRLRAARADILRSYLSKVPAVRVPVPASHQSHACYRLYAYLDPTRLRAGWDREAIVSAIVAEGVPCFSGSCSEIYLEKAFRNAGFGPSERLPVARELGETSLAFLVHPTMSEDDAHDVGRAAAKVLEAALS